MATSLVGNAQENDFKDVHSSDLDREWSRLAFRGIEDRYHDGEELASLLVKRLLQCQALVLWYKRIQTHYCELALLSNFLAMKNQDPRNGC